MKIRSLGAIRQNPKGVGKVKKSEAGWFKSRKGFTKAEIAEIVKPKQSVDEGRLEPPEYYGEERIRPATKEDIYAKEMLKKNVLKPESKKAVFYDSKGNSFTHCPECNYKIVDEFPDVAYVSCSGCPRIFRRNTSVSLRELQDIEIKRINKRLADRGVKR